MAVTHYTVTITVGNDAVGVTVDCAVAITHAIAVTVTAAITAAVTVSIAGYGSGQTLHISISLQWYPAV